MSVPRHRSRAALFAALKRDIENAYPDIRVVVEHGTIIAAGSFPIADGDGILDRFLIELQFPDDYPDSVPILREIGGRIPWHEDRHTNRDGVACPIVPEEWLVRPDRDSIVQFLEGPVRNFFVGQILAEQGRAWPFGEREHGKRGLVQSYGELVGTADEAALVRYLDCLSHDRLKGHWDCPCGSKKRLRNCHFEVLTTLHQKLPPWIAKRALNRLATA
jgi:hypothetical protein